MQNKEVFFPALLITDPLTKYLLDGTQSCCFLQGDRPFSPNRNRGWSPLLYHFKHIHTKISIFLYGPLITGLLGLSRRGRNYSHYQCRKSQKLEAFKVEERVSCPGFSLDRINCLPSVEKNSPEIIIKLIIWLFESCSMSQSTWLRLRRNCEKAMVCFPIRDVLVRTADHWI